MTLDESIKHCEEVAEVQEKLCKANDSFNFSQPKWKECANEHRQLAEWLRELKELKEQQPEDVISRQAVFEAIDDCNSDGLKGIFCSYDDGERFKEYIKNLPSVQPIYNTSEWCHDCSEYDQVKHCCPRFNRVIRNAVKEVKKPKTGHWIGHREHCENSGVMPSGLGAYEWCSDCDCGIDVREWHRNHYNYCPNCGAKMIEPQTESEET